MNAIVDRKEELLIGRDGCFQNKYKRFFGAFGWPNVKETDIASWHWLVIAGEAEDGRIRFIEEHGGDFDDVVAAAVDTKDRLLVQRFYADDTEVEAMRAVRNHDGLSSYHHFGIDDFGRKQWEHPSAHWPHFRNRETTSPVIAVPADQRVSILAGLNLLNSRAKQEKTVVDVQCHWLRMSITEELERAIEHPLVKAAVWVHSALIRQQEAEAHKPTPSQRPSLYGNLKR